jgi:hypothetical protein
LVETEHFLLFFIIFIILIGSKFLFAYYRVSKSINVQKSSKSPKSPKSPKIHKISQICEPLKLNSDRYRVQIRICIIGYSP